MPERTLMLSRSYFVRSFLGLLGIAVLFGAILFLISSATFREAPMLGLLCWIEIGITSIGLLLSIIYHAKRRPGLTLGPDGFTAWQYPMKNIIHAWSEVERIEEMSNVQCRSLFGFRLYRLFMPTCLTLHLVPSAQSHNPIFIYNRANGVGDIVVSGAQLGMSKQELGELIEMYRKANQSNGMIGSRPPIFT